MAALEPAYLVLGTDNAKISTVLERLKAHFPDEAIETHPAQKDSAGDLVASFGTLGLLAEQRLVIVPGAHDWPAADAAKVVEYLSEPSPDVVLLLLADKLAANSRLRKAFQKPRLIECAGPATPAALRTWTEGVFAGTGARGDRAAVLRLIELVCGIDPKDARSVKELDGGDYARLRTDIERIAIYAGDEHVTVAMVEELATRVTDQKVWSLGDAWARGDAPGFMRLVEQLLAQREAPVRLVGAIGRQRRPPPPAVRRPGRSGERARGVGRESVGGEEGRAAGAARHHAPRRRSAEPRGAPRRRAQGREPAWGPRG